MMVIVTAMRTVMLVPAAVTKKVNKGVVMKGGIMGGDITM